MLVAGDFSSSWIACAVVYVAIDGIRQTTAEESVQSCLKLFTHGRLIARCRWLVILGFLIPLMAIRRWALTRSNGGAQRANHVAHSWSQPIYPRCPCWRENSSPAWRRLGRSPCLCLVAPGWSVPRQSSFWGVPPGRRGGRAPSPRVPADSRSLMREPGSRLCDPAVDRPFSLCGGPRWLVALGLWPVS